MWIENSIFRVPIYTDEKYGNTSIHNQLLFGLPWHVTPLNLLVGMDNLRSDQPPTWLLATS